MKRVFSASILCLSTLLAACGTSSTSTPTATPPPTATTGVVAAATSAPVATATTAAQPSATAARTATPASGQTATSGTVADCGTSMDCLIEASKTCKASRAVYTTTVDTMGVLTTLTSTLTIKGPDGSRCGFHVRSDNVDVKFSDAMVKRLKDGGATDDQIKAQQDQVAKQAKTAIGTERNCSFKTEDLTTLLTRWKNGQYSTQDIDNPDCR